MARRQLLASGIGQGAIAGRLRSGALIRVLPGVYAVGHRSAGRIGALWAAWLFAGPDAVFSHQTGGELWEIYHTSSPLIALTTARRLRSRPSLRIHTSPLPADEVTRLQGLPTTTVPRTLLDLAAVLPPRRLERALEEVERRRLADPLTLDALIERYRGRRGVGALRKLIALWKPGSSWTRSELEERFIVFLEVEGIARGEANADVKTDAGWLECDHVWYRERVIVELDSHAHHGHGAAIERDSRKRRALTAAGWVVVTITWRQLRREPAAVGSDLRQLLDARAVGRA